MAKKAKKSKKSATSAQAKPPVVTIMGHVDHGKTTLLDKIRKSSITTSEAGGITQHIGAYQVTHQDKLITFIDTPGHAAFSKMRERGAKVTDIIILVVAADDGVMPQTKESIKHIKAAGVPMILAVNKIDVKGASPEMVKAQLVEEGISVEGYGGDVPVVEISALKGEGIDKLLETVLVLAELEEQKADTNGPLQAIVIESQLKKNQGPVATLMVQTGELKTGQTLSSVGIDTPITGNVKRLTNDQGKAVKTASVSTPVVVLGLREVPLAGTIFTTLDHVEAVTKNLTEADSPDMDIAATAPVQDFSLPDEEEEEKISIKMILVADTFGSLEAIKNNLTEEIELIKTHTGEVNESDVMHAQSTGAVIIAFSTKIAKTARKLAEIEKVPVRKYDVIYQLLEDFQNQILKLLEPTIDETELGTAKIKAIFEIRGDVIAGCSVLTGAISLGDKIHLRRNDRIIADSKVVSIKQGKVEVEKVDKDNQCGLIFKPALKIEEGDTLSAYKKNE